MRARARGRIRAAILALLMVPGAGLAAEQSALSDEVPGYRTDQVPDRPAPLLELGEPLLGGGPLGEGITLPTGAVWRPSLLVFGTYRTALQLFDGGLEPRQSEWANRLDLFGQLRLSPTERLLVGLRPLDDEEGFSGYHAEPGSDDGWQGNFQADLEILFFEGDFGELFPKLDLDDTARLDIGFSVGRQPLIFQDGMLLVDRIDSIGLTRNNLFIPGTSNTRLTFLYGWNHVDRNDNRDDSGAKLYGLFAETDTRRSTINLDLVWVDSNQAGGDGLFGGVSATQRLGRFNTTFRALGSWAIDEETARASDGALLFAEVSWSPPHAHNHAYATAFYGIDEFASAARDRDAGGPLGRVGILFAAVGLGRSGAPLSNRPDHAFGGALGYQMFFDGSRRQLILELGALRDRDGSDRSAFASAARFQQAIGRRIVVVLDGFVGRREKAGLTHGERLELLIKF